MIEQFLVSEIKNRENRYFSKNMNNQMTQEYTKIFD